MSRIGKLPVQVPAGVNVEISGSTVKVQGPMGALERTFPSEISIRKDGEMIVVERPNDERRNRALHGLSRTLVSNMVVGVTSGFNKEL